MELNLRKARKLEGKIAKHIEAATLKGETSVRVKGSLEDALAKIQKSGESLLNDLQTLRQLNEVRYNIRGQIANANQGTGINALMTEREQLKSKSQLLLKLLNVQVAPPTEEVADLLTSKAALLDKGGDRFGRGSEVTVDVSVVSEPVRESINTEIKATIKGLEDVEDELAQKNLGSKVTLSEETVALLKAQALI